MKNIVITILAVVSVVSFISCYQMSSRASYWMNRCDAAEEVINRMADDNEDYFLDVIMEGDEYNSYYSLGSNQQ